MKVVVLMYNPEVNYQCKLEVTINELISQLEKKYNVKSNQAAYALNEVLSQDIVACILIDRGVASVSDYLVPCDDGHIK